MSEHAGGDASAANPGVVLVPRGGMWGASVAAEVADRGLVPWLLPVVETVPAPSAELTRALTGLAEGRYGWLVLTSAAAVPALDGAAVPAGTRVAAVGAATAHALREAGIAVHLVGASGALGLLDLWPGEPEDLPVLLVRSDLARTTFADGLRARGWQVDSVIAYRTVAAATSSGEEDALRGGNADVALVTSGSVARRLADIGLPASTRVVAMGEQTAEDARAAGLEVAAVADEPSVAALARCATEVLEAR